MGEWLRTFAGVVLWMMGSAWMLVAWFHFQLAVKVAGVAVRSRIPAPGRNSRRAP